MLLDCEICLQTLSERVEPFYYWEAEYQFHCAYIFEDVVVQALVELGSKHNILHCDATSVYIKIISTW